MDSDYKDSFTTVRILSDKTEGLIHLKILKRHGQDRDTKIKNNFVGQLSKTNSQTLVKITELLSSQLPPKTDKEVVVGLMTSGVIMCGYLAMIRESFFNYSVYSKFGDYENAFNFTEEHRGGKRHFLYGVRPGDEIIIVEDEVTSGNGISALIKALREFGCGVKAVACVLETINFNARENIQKQTGMELISLTEIELS